MRGDIGMQTTFSVLSDVLSGTPGAPAGPETCLNMNKTTFELIRTPFEDTLKEDNFSWRLGVNYKPNRDVLIYALASRGYKSGSRSAERRVGKGGVRQVSLRCSRYH